VPAIANMAKQGVPLDLAGEAFAVSTRDMSVTALGVSSIGSIFKTLVHPHSASTIFEEIAKVVSWSRVLIQRR
jgi:hypothetical protein